MSRLLLAVILFCPTATTEPAEELTRSVRARCVMNLVEIGTEILAYAQKTGGTLPSKLSEAFADKIKEKGSCLTCPAVRPAITAGGFFPSYAYVNVVPGRRKLADAEGDILVFDSEPVHDGGRNVLLSDAEEEGRFRVKYLPEADFQKMLADQTARWEGKGKKLEIVRRDLLPLEGLQLETSEKPGRTARGFFASFHFKVALIIIVTIAAVVVLLALLAMQGRKPKER